jgi:uracil-DNA glycosylase family 4
MHTLLPENNGERVDACVTTEHIGLIPSPTSTPIIFVGMNPGYHECITGRPFIGDSGQILRNTYIGGMTPPLTERASIYLTNLVRCGPKPNPPAFAAKTCITYTKSDLADIFFTHYDATPVIVFLGEYACVKGHRLLFDVRTRFKQARDNQFQIHNVLERDCVVLTTVHPAAVLRDNNWIHTVEDHFNMLDDYLSGTLAAPTKPNIIPPRAPNP